MRLRCSGRWSSTYNAAWTLHASASPRRGSRETTGADFFAKSPAGFGRVTFEPADLSDASRRWRWTATQRRPSPRCPGATAPLPARAREILLCDRPLNALLPVRRSWDAEDDVQRARAAAAADAHNQVDLSVRRARPLEPQACARSLEYARSPRGRSARRAQGCLSAAQPLRAGVTGLPRPSSAHGVGDAARAGACPASRARRSLHRRAPPRTFALAPAQRRSHPLSRGFPPRPSRRQPLSHDRDYRDGAGPDAAAPSARTATVAAVSTARAALSLRATARGMDGRIRVDE